MNETVFVNAYSVNFGRKESFITIETKKRDGKVLFESRWRKIIFKNNLEYVRFNGLEFSVKGL